MKTKFIYLIALILLCTMRFLGQTDIPAADRGASQYPDIELEKTIREAIKNSQYIYVGKLKNRVKVRTGESFTGRHGETVYILIWSNRMLIDRNLKGPAKKLKDVKDDFFEFKKGTKYLIFANSDNYLTKAINLDGSAKALEITEKILAEK